MALTPARIAGRAGILVARHILDRHKSAETRALVRARLDAARALYARMKRESGRAEKEYNPSQPRVPAGNSEGGQWAVILGPRLTLARSELDTLQNRMLIEPTRFSTLDGQEVLNRREIFARNVRRAVESHNLPDESKWREKLDEIENEIGRRKQLANIKRRISALEEGISTGKLTVSESEMRQLISSMGDVYFDNGLVRDVGGRADYNPDLFRTSDLTGARIRFYVILPDGSIVHPDELSDFRGRGRIVVVEDARLETTKTVSSIVVSYVEKATLDGLPRPLRWLIQSLLDAIGEWWSDLAAGDMTLPEWMAAMRDALAEYHLAGFMAGNGSEDVSATALSVVAEQVSVQLDYLNGFKAELQSAAEYAAGAQARAESYAPAIKVPYWTGKTKVLPLPAMPCQGVQCGNRCNCRWSIVAIDESKNDYDCFWELEPGSQHCQSCLQRASEWQPVKIRDGVLE